MEFLPKDIEAYVLRHTPKESAILHKINRETHLKVMQPRMLSGHFQGQLLRFLVEMIQPKRILEIGTYTGYSAIAMAQGLKTGGKLITIDVNAELEKMISNFIIEAGLADKIEQITGNAIEILPTLTEKFDLIFIDADKRNYRNYLDLVLNNLNTGGYILTDNVLWSGKVTMPKEKMDLDTRLIDEFNDYVQNHPQLVSILLPVRDGLYISRKID
jgi:predicted O-methyltransferase YrrM